ALAAQVKPLRGALGTMVKPGHGPDAARRAKSWFTLRLHARAENGRSVITEVRGGDPGYGDTAKMLAESALCLAFDDLPPAAGQLTPATAMGQALIERLTRAGIEFRTFTEPPTRAPGPGPERRGRRA